MSSGRSRLGLDTQQESMRLTNLGQRRHPPHSNAGSSGVCDRRLCALPHCASFVAGPIRSERLTICTSELSCLKRSICRSASLNRDFWPHPNSRQCGSCVKRLQAKSRSWTCLLDKGPNARSNGRLPGSVRGRRYNVMPRQVDQDRPFRAAFHYGSNRSNCAIDSLSMIRSRNTFTMDRFTSPYFRHSIAHRLAIDRLTVIVTPSVNSLARLMWH